MRESNVNLSNPLQPVMESESLPGQLTMSNSDSNFGFAFNDSNFSDRVLRIEIVPDLPETSKDYSEVFTGVANWACRNRKRLRDEIKSNNVTDGLEHREEIILNPPDRENGVDDYNQDEQAMTVIEESPSNSGTDLNRIVDEAIQHNGFSPKADCSSIFKVKSIHICSPILAVKSPFFFKLFSNGMMESEQRHATLRIHASEEAGLMDLLNFMYSNTLSVATPSALLDVVMAADKYEVASCIRFCGKLLQNLPMTFESALLYLELPASVLLTDAMQPLIDAAKQFLVAQYRDLSKFHDEVLNLPIAGVEVVLSSDDLQVTSEDVVFDFVLKWTQKHYPKLEDRQQVIRARLSCLIRFPFLSSRKLRKVLRCKEFDHELASKLVFEALFFKAETPHGQRSLIASATNSVFHQRAYKYRPVKVVEFELPSQHSIVYLDLKQEECAHLFPNGRLYSQAFHIGGQVFFLSAHCNMNRQRTSYHFGLSLGMLEKQPVTFAFDYEFFTRSTESTGEYQTRFRGTYSFTGGKAVGCRDVFGTPWMSFMDENSKHFINGILYIRAELTVRQ